MLDHPLACRSLCRDTRLAADLRQLAREARSQPEIRAVMDDLPNAPDTLLMRKRGLQGTSPYLRQGAVPPGAKL
jgi:hypothetical protein